jgi:hypothetical protein
MLARRIGGKVRYNSHVSAKTQSIVANKTAKMCRGRVDKQKVKEEQGQYALYL